MRHHLFSNVCLALIAGCAMLVACSDDDPQETLKGNVVLDTQNATIPAEGTLSETTLTISDQGGTFAIPLLCGLEEKNIQAAYTVQVPTQDATWCKATIANSKLTVEVSAQTDKQTRNTTINVAATAENAEIKPLTLTVNQSAKTIPAGTVTMDTENMVVSNASLSENTLTLAYIGGEAQIPVGNTLEDSNVAVEYTLTGADEATDWLTVTLENGQLNITAKPTANKNESTAVLTIAAAGKSEETAITSLQLMVKQAKFESSIDMVVVEGGTFVLGEGKDYTYSEYAHDVTVSSFYIATTEVTQKLYEEIMGTNPSYSSFKGDNYPVNQITWSEACEFCNKLSEREGLIPAYKQEGVISIDWSYGAYPPVEVPNYIYDPLTVSNGYRLPTSAEWEFAAKGGNEGCKNLTIFSGSDSYSEVGWWQDNSVIGGIKSLHEVTQLKANGLGIYDMSGNVGEWCYDYGYPYGYDYSLEPETDPTGPAKNINDSKIYRGGYYDSYDTNGKVNYINKADPSETNKTIGFRVVRTIK